MSITNMMTFEVGFREKSNQEGELQVLEFSVYYDKNSYDDPKDVAIDHCIKIKDVDDGFVDFRKLTPVFETFKVLADVIPSDLGMK